MLISYHFATKENSGLLCVVSCPTHTVCERWTWDFQIRTEIFKLSVTPQNMYNIKDF